MRSNRNILHRQDSTLKSAEIVSFRQSQSIDNQCLFFCQNVTSFTGKEKDSETGFYYFGARYYDPSLSGLFISIDPMSDKYPSISPYVYCNWNPVKLVDPDGEEASEHIDKFGYIIVHYEDGDNGVYLHNEGTTKEKIDMDRMIQNNTYGFGEKIGELGVEIDMNAFFINKLDESSTVAKTIGKSGDVERLRQYAEKVKTNGVWDLKNNKNTIWGVAWNYDMNNGTKTFFISDLIGKANAADVGNFHAGYTGIKANISPYLLCKGAGAAECIKSIKNLKLLDAVYRLNALLTPLNRRSGDRKRDYYYNTFGMRCAGGGNI